jgi:methylmalonyl-CoA mutase cobalamin-binding subunit
MNDPTPRHTIATVALRTGIGQDQLRTWERRLGLLSPGRSQGGRRLYSDADVARLMLVKAALAKGLRIGDVSRLDSAGLVALTGGGLPPAAERSRGEDSAGRAATDPSRWLESCLHRLAICDAPGLAEDLGRASVECSLPRLLDGLVLPLLCEVGEGWREGRLRIGQEHLASVAVRQLLERLRAARRAAPGAPRLLTGTLSGQRHELGALMAAVWAAEAGWETIHAGADLPAEELVLLANRVEARVLALSLSLPVDPGLVEELARLGDLLPAQVDVVVGGPALALLPATVRARLHVLEGLDQLPDFLATLAGRVSS